MRDSWLWSQFFSFPALQRLEVDNMGFEVLHHCQGQLWYPWDKHILFQVLQTFLLHASRFHSILQDLLCSRNPWFDRFVSIIYEPILGMNMELSEKKIYFFDFMVMKDVFTSLKNFFCFSYCSSKRELMGWKWGMILLNRIVFSGGFLGRRVLTVIRRISEIVFGWSKLIFVKSLKVLVIFYKEIRGGIQGTSGDTFNVEFHDERDEGDLKKINEQNKDSRNNYLLYEKQASLKTCRIIS